MSRSSSGRKLFGSPILLQDWDREAEEGAAQYWELFLDLLLVAAASSLADHFKEDQDFWSFALYFFILVNGWNLYTHHITTRFQDASLAHSLVLFVYFIGFGVCIVNVGNPAQFAAGALVQRISVLVMVAQIARCIPRARYFCAVLAGLTGVTMVGLLVAVSPSSKKWKVMGLWMAALIELLGELFLVVILEGPRLVPINIEQSKERLGALELIMLGETALSVTITYRELDQEDIVGQTKNRYYWVLGLSFLLIFMFCLLYFHMLPEPQNHALRRSRWHGTLLMLVHKVLGLALLAVGTSVKLVVEAVMLEEETESQFVYRLLGWGVGAALLVLYLIRLLHFGGRSELHFGNSTLVYGQRPDLDRIATIWWIQVAIAWPIPFIGVALGVTTHDPFSCLALHAGLLFLLCVVESFYSHTLEKAVADQCPARHEGERQPLVDHT